MSEPDVVRTRYLVDAIMTATPAQRIVMLYDRMQMDIDRALADLESGSQISASTHLRHAQAIVTELWGSLDVSTWTGASDLVSLYGFLLREFIDADRFADAGRLAGCRLIVTSLRATWAEAAEKVSAEQFATLAAVSATRVSAAARASFSPAAEPVAATSWVG